MTMITASLPTMLVTETMTTDPMGTMSADSRYRRYCEWCEGLRLPSAPFDVWWKTVND